MTKLAGFGFPLEVQQRLGALAVVWGMFETSLEEAIWSLRGEEIHGVRPWTDGKPISAMIDELDRDWLQLPEDARAVIRAGARTARDLMEYRHSIFHGWLLPSPAMPAFIRNPRWHGEQRKRASHDAHVSENLLDMAIDCAWTLCQVTRKTKAACGDQAAIPALVALKADVTRAKSSASELRNLTSLMNHEKY